MYRKKICEMKWYPYLGDMSNLSFTFPHLLPLTHNDNKAMVVWYASYDSLDIDQPTIDLYFCVVVSDSAIIAVLVFFLFRCVRSVHSAFVFVVIFSFRSFVR